MEEAAARRRVLVERLDEADGGGVGAARRRTHVVRLRGTAVRVGALLALAAPAMGDARAVAWRLLRGGRRWPEKKGVWRSVSARNNIVPAKKIQSNFNF